MDNNEILVYSPGSSSFEHEDTVTDSIAFNLELSSIGSGPDSGSYSGSYSSLSTVSVDDDPQLVHPDPKYECLVCTANNSGHRLLRDPVQTMCGHRLCRTCVEVYLGTALSKQCPAGEDECELVTRDSIIPDPGCRREIKLLPVFCFYRSKGCKHKVKLGLLEKHKAECEFRDVPCTYLPRGCGQRIQFRNLSKHLLGCGYRPFNCKLCGLEFNFSSKKEHDAEICPEAAVTCPYTCGIQNLKRRQLNNHKTECPRKPEECKFKNMGCTKIGSKEEIEKHELDVSIHFPVLLEYLTALKSSTLDQQKEIEEIKSRERSLENQIKNTNRELKLKMVPQIERLIIMERKVDEQAQAITSLTMEVRHLQTSVDHLKTLIPQVAKHEGQLATHGMGLNEMGLKLQMIETASYDGTLLWKISDFSKRKQDAVDGRTVSLYSQPFYTSKYGYKMCGRVYLNGDGIGRGTHLSLYFVVMRGDYDALLPWPFQCKVTLMLLSQSPQKLHLKDEFVPDRATGSSSYSRPQITEMNPASGCPLFVTHSVLENPLNHYVKEDSIFIKIMVDTSNLETV